MKNPTATKTSFSLSPPVRRSSVQSSKFSVQCSKFFGFAPIFYLLSSIFFLVGCTAPRPLKGGKAFTARTPTGGLSQVLLQGENPSVPSRQAQETVKVRTYTLPADISPIPSYSSHHSHFQPNTPPLQDSSTPFVIVTEREETRAKTELGAAQKDTARELGAKLSSLKGLVWVGVLMFVFGIASFAWPPLKAIIGSVTTSAALTLGGVALIILPSLLIGNELLIFAGVALAIGVWFLAHRHGRVHGELSAARQARPFWNS